MNKNKRTTYFLSYCSKDKKKIPEGTASTRHLPVSVPRFSWHPDCPPAKKSEVLPFGPGTRKHAESVGQMPPIPIEKEEDIC
jgi:hypothetical protein